MPGAVLGTHIIEFVGDRSQLTREMRTSEKESAEYARKVSANVDAGVRAGFEKARGEVPKLTGAIRSGLTAAVEVTRKIADGSTLTAQELQRVRVALMRVRTQAVQDFGSIEKASDDTRAAIAGMELALERGTAELRRQRVMMEDARKATTEAGFRYSSLAEAAADVAKGHGAMGQQIGAGIVKVAAASLVVQEFTRVIQHLYDAASTSDNKFYSEKLEKLKKWQDKEKRSVYDVTLTWIQYQKARLFGDTKALEDLAKALGPADLSAIDSLAKRRDAQKEVADAAFEEWKALELAHLAREKDIVSRKLQLAEVEKNTPAIKRYTAELALLTEKEALANGETWQHAAAVKSLTLQTFRATQAAQQRGEAEKRLAAEADARMKALLARQPDFFKIKPILDVNATGAVNANTLLMIRERQRAMEAAATAEFHWLVGFNQRFQDATKSREAMIARLTERYVESATTIEDVMGRAATNVESTFSDVLFSGITGNLEGVTDSFRGFFKNLLREITNFMAQQAVKKLLMFFLNRYMGGAYSTDNVNAAMDLFGYAAGGVVPGGFKAFASGGVVTRPTLGLVGEGKHNEAVVPLPDGKSIPVDLGGANRAPQLVNVEVVWHPEFIRAIVAGAAQQGRALARQDVIPITMQDLATNGPLRKLIQASVG